LYTNISEEHAASIFRVDMSRVRMFMGYVGDQTREHRKTGQLGPWEGESRLSYLGQQEQGTERHLLSGPPEKEDKSLNIVTAFCFNKNVLYNSLMLALC
jgi:hypothetical protein